MHARWSPGRRSRRRGAAARADPRCDRCPVVLFRLEAQGFVAALEEGRFLVLIKVKKKQLKAVRA